MVYRKSKIIDIAGAFFMLFICIGTLSAEDNSIYVYRSYYTLGIYDFFNGHDIDNAKYFTTSEYGLNNGIGYSTSLTRSLDMEFEVNAINILKKESVLPNGNNVNYIQITAGTSLHKRFGIADFYAGIFLGSVSGFNLCTEDLTGTAGIKLGVDLSIGRTPLSIGFQSRMSMLYLYSDDSLYESMTYLIDPVSLVMKWRF